MAHPPTDRGSLGPYGRPFPRVGLLPRRPRRAHWVRLGRVAGWLCLGFALGYGICFVLARDSF